MVTIGEKFVLAVIALMILELSGCQCVNQAPTGWSPVELGGHWGYQDSAGRIVIPPKYFMAYPFLDTGLAAVADEQGWIFINKWGEEIIRPYILDNGPDDFSEGLARFVRAGKFGYFDRRGKVAIAPRFDFAERFQNGRAAVCQGCARVPDGEHTRIEGGEWYWINRKGEITGPREPGERPRP